MIQKLLCWVIGHKTVVKAFTGETMMLDTALEREIKHACYKWSRLEFCLRCGKRVHYDTN